MECTAWNSVRPGVSRVEQRAAQARVDGELVLDRARRQAEQVAIEIIPLRRQ